MPSERSRRGFFSLAFFAPVLLAAVVALFGCTGASLGGDPRGFGSGTAGGAAGGPPTVGGDWCVASSVLRANCQGCHAATPLYGAPMPLVTFDNLHAIPL